MSNINTFQVSGKVVKIYEQNKYGWVEFIVQQEKTYQGETKQTFTKITIKSDKVNFRLDDLILVSGTAGGAKAKAKDGHEFYSSNLYANTILFLRQNTPQQQPMQQSMQPMQEDDGGIPF